MDCIFGMDLQCAEVGKYNNLYDFWPHILRWLRIAHIDMGLDILLGLLQDMLDSMDIHRLVYNQLDVKETENVETL